MTPRPRPAADGHDRRHARRQDPGLPPRRPPGHAAPTRGRRVPAAADQLMAGGVYDIPKVETRGRSGRHEHHADRRLPRRGPPGGDRRDRAGDGPVRRRDRHGPGRGAPAQLRRARRVPVRHHPTGGVVRHRRVRTRRWTGCSRPPATPSCAPSRRAGASAATHVQLGIGLSTYVEITGGRRRRRDGARSRSTPTAPSPCCTGSSAARPGPRARRGRCSSRRARHPDGPDHRRSTVTPTRSPTASARSAPRSLQLGGVGGAAGRARGHGRGARSWRPSCSRPTPSRPRARHRQRALAGPRRAADRLSWAQLAEQAGAGRAVRGRRVRAPSSRRSRSARTSRSSRSTSRPARPGSSGTSPSTTPGRSLNPLPRRGAAARRHRAGRRAGAHRGGPLRRGRQPA